MCTITPRTFPDPSTPRQCSSHPTTRSKPSKIKRRHRLRAVEAMHSHCDKVMEDMQADSTSVQATNKEDVEEDTKVVMVPNEEADEVLKDHLLTTQMVSRSQALRTAPGDNRRHQLNSRFDLVNLAVRSLS